MWSEALAQEKLKFTCSVTKCRKVTELERHISLLKFLLHLTWCYFYKTVGLKGLICISGNLHRWHWDNLQHGGLGGQGWVCSDRCPQTNRHCLQVSTIQGAEYIWRGGGQRVSTPHVWPDGQRACQVYLCSRQCRWVIRHGWMLWGIYPQNQKIKILLLN